MRRKVAIAAVVLVLLMSSIGVGYAYTAITFSENNNLGVNHISVVNSDGGSYIQVPSYL